MIRHKIDEKSLQKINLIAWAILLINTTFTGIFLAHGAIHLESAPPRDFLAFWSASKLALSGHAELAFDTEALRQAAASITTTGKTYGWFYPPTFQAITLPLGLFEYNISFFGFMGITLALYIFSACRIVQYKKIFLIAISFPGIFIALLFGQNSLLTAALAMLGLSYLPHRPFLAGALIGLISIKPHLGIVFPLALIIGGNWRAIISATGTAALMIVISIALIGDAPWHTFIHNIATAKQSLETENLAMHAMISPFATLIQIHGNLTIAYIGQALMAAFSTLILIKIFKNTKTQSIRNASVMAATLSMSPYLFDYELTWLGGTIFFMLRAAATEGISKIGIIAIFIGWIFPLIDFITGNLFGMTSLQPIINILLLIAILDMAKHPINGANITKPTRNFLQH